MLEQEFIPSTLSKMVLIGFRTEDVIVGSQDITLIQTLIFVG